MDKPLTQDRRPDANDLLTPPENDALGPVRAWSFSALSVFEECPYRTFIGRVKRIQEPQGEAAERGHNIHQMAEDYVRGKLEPLPKELMSFEDEFDELKRLYDLGSVELEGDWGYTSDWSPTGWMSADTWCRIKLDAFVRQHDGVSARVIDYKTGKKYAVKHGQQGLLYAIGAFARFPELEMVQTEFWYTDMKRENKTVRTFTRDQAMKFQPGFHKRGVAMTTETEFPPTPSKDSCRFCSYRKGDHPECRFGVV